MTDWYCNYIRDYIVGSGGVGSHCWHQKWTLLNCNLELESYNIVLLRVYKCIRNTVFPRSIGASMFHRSLYYWTYLCLVVIITVHYLVEEGSQFASCVFFPGLCASKPWIKELQRNSHLPAGHSGSLLPHHHVCLCSHTRYCTHQGTKRPHGVYL